MIGVRIRSRLLAACAALALAAAPAMAAPIVGSLTLASDGVVDNGTNLMMRDLFVPDSLHVGLRTGNFVLIPVRSAIVGGTLDLMNLDGFGFSIPGVGAFTDTGVKNVIGQRTASNLDVYLLGVFTPDATGPLAAFDPSPSSVRLSLTRTGMDADFSVSFSGTEAAPPAPLPEPISLALLGAGVMAIGMVRRRTAA